MIVVKIIYECMRSQGDILEVFGRRITESVDLAHTRNEIRDLRLPVYFVTVFGEFVREVLKEEISAEAEESALLTTFRPSGPLVLDMETFFADQKRKRKKEFLFRGMNIECTETNFLDELNINPLSPRVILLNIDHLEVSKSTINSLATIARNGSILILSTQKSLEHTDISIFRTEIENELKSRRHSDCVAKGWVDCSKNHIPLTEDLEYIFESSWIEYYSDQIFGKDLVFV